jgi:hypothetical protein
MESVLGVIAIIVGAVVALYLFKFLRTIYNDLFKD